MHYIGSSSKLRLFILGQTQYSQYFRAESHFKNSLIRLGINREDFDKFEIFSLPGDQLEFGKRIQTLDKEGYFPLNRSFKYLQLISEFTKKPVQFQIIEEKSQKFEKNQPKNKEKHAYGEFQRVLLSDKQYQKLCAEFTEELVKQVIPRLDEYLEGNNNKNHYTNYYILMKRAIREDWYHLRKPRKVEHKEEPTPEFVQDFLKNIK